MIMPDRLDDTQKLELLNQWLDCDAGAGERLWRMPGLIETKCLEDHLVALLQKYCWGFNKTKEYYPLKRCWERKWKESHLQE